MDEAQGQQGRESHVVRRMPIVLIHAHDRCNCRCAMCDIWKTKSARELSVADVEKMRESFVRMGVEHVVLTGGEPLLNAKLKEIVSVLSELPVKRTLLTSGLLLRRQADWVSRSFDEVIVSLDGPEFVHDEIRHVSGAFRLVALGVEELRRLSATVQIGARCTVQKKNHARLVETVQCARKMGFDSVSFLAADLESDAFNRLPVWPQSRQDGIALSGEELNTLDDQIERLIAIRMLTPAQFIAETPERLRRISAHFKAYTGIAQREAPVCNAPWVSAVVELDGSVKPCFFHPPIGNTNTAALHEIVNSPAAMRFREELRMQQNPICQRCVCSLNYRGPVRGEAERAQAVALETLPA